MKKLKKKNLKSIKNLNEFLFKLKNFLRIFFFSDIKRLILLLFIKKKLKN
jgi:hypothetical protein